MRASPKFAQGLVCSKCGAVVVKRGAMQKYCASCSEVRDLERKRLWARDHPVLGRTRDRSVVLAKGAEINAGETKVMAHMQEPPSLNWLVRLKFPFDWSASKNHLWAVRPQGHVAMREESRNYRAALSLKIKTALQGRRVEQNKVWLDIFVQKPNHRGDAANFVDLICDAVKDAIGVDDRWFSIRQLDWQITKNDPHIFLTIGQEDPRPAQICSPCGRILTLDAFHRNKGTKNGVGRICKECASVGVALLP